MRDPLTANAKWYVDLLAKILLPGMILLAGHWYSEAADKRAAAARKMEAENARQEALLARSRSEAGEKANRDLQLLAWIASPDSEQRRVGLRVARFFIAPGDTLIDPALMNAVNDIIGKGKSGSVDAITVQLAADLKRTLAGALAWVHVGDMRTSSGKWIWRLAGDITVAPGSILLPGAGTYLEGRRPGVEDGHLITPSTVMVRGTIPGEELRIVELDTLRPRSDTAQVWASVYTQWTKNWGGELNR